MSDAGRLVGSTVLVVVLGAVPAWVVQARNAENTVLAAPKMSGPCVEPATQMRRDHQVLLAEWRKTVVRSGARVHRSSDGRTFAMGLEASCLACHGSATDFCEKCHATAGVTVSCWGCHSGEAPGARQR